MDPARPPHAHRTRRALLVAHRGASHHLVGVGTALRAASWEVLSETLQSDVPVRVCRRSIAQSDVVIYPDSDPQSTHELRRHAAELGVPTVLQMDGVLEYANTFLNPKFERRLLQPAPAGLVFASGTHDREILEALGNQAVPVGLPRLDDFRNRFNATIAAHAPRGLMVATANQPWFTPGGRERLLAALFDLTQAAGRMGVYVRWRVSSEIARVLGVERDSLPLIESLSRVEGVITTASTLAFEAMIARKPVGIVHPHPWPLWIPCTHRFDGRSDAGIDDDRANMQRLGGVDEPANRAAELSIGQMLGGHRVQTERQAEPFIASLLQPDPPLSEVRARILERYVQRGAADSYARALPVRTTKHAEPRTVLHQSEAYTGPTPGDLSQAVRRLVCQGASRVVVAVNTLVTPEMWSLAADAPAQFVGFVVRQETHDQILLGCPASGHRQFVEAFRPDGLVLTAPEDDLSILAAMLWSTPIATLLTTADPANPKFAHAEDVISGAKRALIHGKVRTTIRPGLCAGLESMPPDQVLLGDRPAMILLAGDEVDFQIYQRARPLRDLGTEVHSLRWSGQELDGCERFAKLVRRIDHEPYAIYGGGQHTAHLLGQAIITHRPRAIFDDAGAPGDTLDGIPILPLDQLMPDEISVLVLSSLRHEKRLWEQTSHLRAMGVEVRPLYAGF